jgi:hypothetical protein
LRRLLAAAALLALPAGPALAGTPYTMAMTCPIGGERFNFTTTGGYSIFSRRPDGMPYGSWTFPLDIPECPGNGLIVYKEPFEPAELARLERLIASDDYRALRVADVKYYRLSWLLREMGASRPAVLWALVQAGWQAPVGSPLRARYLAELAQGTAAVEGEPADLTGYAMRGRWINALRELGRLDEAAALLARTPLAPLQAGGTLAEAGDGDRADWLAYYTMQGALIARRNSAAEPADFTPSPAAVARRCRDEAVLDSVERAYCARAAADPAD